MTIEAMTVDITGLVEHRALRERITTRMIELLAQFAVAPARAQVMFVDENGPKGGVDCRCAVTVQRPGQPSVHVEHLAETPPLAFDATFKALERRLGRDRARRRQGRRHPKKYFAASHLLAMGG